MSYITVTQSLMEWFTNSSWITLSLMAIDVTLFILCLSSIWFYSYATYAALEFFGHSSSIDSSFHPPVTILKPLCGLDPDSYKNLTSFCQQDYPVYQIIFAVRDRHDPVIEVVHQIIDQFSHLDIQLLVNDRVVGTNFKVSNLANAEPSAKHSILVLADSDVRVGPEYLRRITQPLQDPEVGVVTCPYRSLTQGWVSTLEAIGTATEYHAGILVARKLSGMDFAFGQTIVIRKAALEAIGGFAAIADYLADDFLLGYLPTQKDYKVVLSDYVVEHVLTADTPAGSIQRQIRWARGIRVSRPWGYLGLISTYGTITSFLFLLTTGGSALGWAVLVTTWFVRLAMAWVIGVSGLQDEAARKFFWAVPLRDLLSFTVWCYSFLGNSIAWRGRNLLLTKDGKLATP
jgi:ceramide glucosyltransferase